MKIAIHHSRWSFSNEWIKYCKENQIEYKIVNCYASDIIGQIKDCDVLMWHHHHSLAKDSLFAKQLLFSVEQSGKKVFPDFNTGWHFDDKLGQKYLLESINAPLANSYAFYSKQEAYKWIDQTGFPKVFKLRSGAGSSNVKLIQNKIQARNIVKKAFGKGFSSYDRIGNFKDVFQKYRLGKQSFMELLKSIRRLFVATEFSKVSGKQIGYVLFQDFIPDNDSDIRVVIIGKKAFAIKRLVRKNDFRASGSGFIEYDKEKIDERCISLAFETSKKLKAQCLAYDFVFDKNNSPLIIEINYGYALEGYADCPGYWDNKLNWHEEKFNSAHWMVDLFIN